MPFLGLCTPGEIGPSHLTSIPASLIDVFQSPSPCWGAIVNRLAALTLPSGPCRGAWAQLDSPYRLLADTAADWSYAFPHSHKHHCSQALRYKRQKIGEAYNKSCNDDDSCSIPNNSAGSKWCCQSQYKLKLTLGVIWDIVIIYQPYNRCILIRSDDCEWWLYEALLCNKLPWVSLFLIPVRDLYAEVTKEFNWRCTDVILL